MKRLKLLDVVLAVAMGVLAVTTLIMVVGTALGAGAADLEARIAPPYEIELADGQRMEVTAGPTSGPGPWDIDVGDDQTTLGRPEVRAHLALELDDLDARAMAGLQLLATLVPVWIALWNLSGIVRASRNGLAFHPVNARRLQRIAVAVAALPILTRLALLPVEGRYDGTLGIDLLPEGPGVWPCLIAALGLLALAEVFRQGSELRELEQGTV